MTSKILTQYIVSPQISWNRNLSLRNLSCCRQTLISLLEQQKKKRKEEKNEIEAKREEVCQTTVWPSQTHIWAQKRSSTAPMITRSGVAVNHALIIRSRFINQTWFPVSLELKDTEVRAYRTDPVQVRSCCQYRTRPFFKIISTCLFINVGYFQKDAFSSFSGYLVSLQINQPF